MVTTKQDSTFDPKHITPGFSLLPFTNQVGGHTPFFRLSKRAICKPAERKEQEFYVYLESHHPELLPFLSQYLGMLNATYHQDKQAMLPEVIFDNNEQLLKDWHALSSQQSDRGTPSTTPDILNDDFQQWSPNADECNLRFTEFRKRALYEVLNPTALRERIKLQNTCLKQNAQLQQNDTNIEKLTIQLKVPLNDHMLDGPLFNETVGMVGDPDDTITSNLNVGRNDNSTSHAFNHDETSSARWLLRRTPSNPWGQQMYEKDRLKLQQLTEACIVKQFIILEDLTDNIQYPCVLDLKMGNRHYGVFSSAVKKRSQIAKCVNSTSYKLGVRICGMQVYKSQEQKFVFHEKYMGHSLDEEGFKQNLAEYLDGLLDHIPVLLKKLDRLARIIKSLKGFRFYASSLLLIYDGGAPKSSRNCRIDVRMIDFAKCVSPDDDSSQFTYPLGNPTGPDEGYLLGISSLIHKFTEIYKEHQIKNAL